MTTGASIHDLLNCRAPDMDELRVALADLHGSVVALGGRWGMRVNNLARDIATGVNVPDAVIAQAMSGGIGRARPPALIQAPGGRSVAFVQIYGVALPKFEWPGLAYSTFGLAETVAALGADANIAAIILDVDSPGGAVVGTPEAAAAVYAARQRKPVIAHVSGLCASAAYWIASQATTVQATLSSEIGSIGIYVLHLDVSEALSEAGIKPTFIFDGKYKVEGNGYEPLSAEARDHLQREVSKIGAKFRADVARGRGVTVDDVAKNFGQGRTMPAPEAKRANMIDAIGGFGAAVQLAARPPIPTRTAGAQARRAMLTTHRQSVTKSEQPIASGPSAARRRRLALLRQA